MATRCAGEPRQAFKIFKTIDLYPDLESPDRLWREMGELDTEILEPAYNLFQVMQIQIPREMTQVCLVVVTPFQLGFRKPPRTSEMYRRALEPEFCLALCPDQVGPRLRVEYPDQPGMDRLQIAMVPRYVESDYQPGYHTFVVATGWTVGITLGTELLSKKTRWPVHHSKFVFVAGAQ